MPAPFPFEQLPPEAKAKIYNQWQDESARGDWEVWGEQKWRDYINSTTPHFPTAEEYINEIVKLLPQPKEQYDKVNPFFFDEQAAREVAEAEYSPYYQEILADYLTDVGKVRERAGEDKASVVSELEAQKDYYLETKGTNLDRLIRGIKEGYEGKGLYFSGENIRTQREAREDTEKELNDYLRQYQYKTTGVETDYQRQLEDLALGEERKKRDVERERQAAIEGGVLQQRGEALEEYEYGRQKYYETPNWGSII